MPYSLLDFPSQKLWRRDIDKGAEEPKGDLEDKPEVVSEKLSLWRQEVQNVAQPQDRREYYKE